MTSLSFFTIVCAKDFEQWRLQARSLARYWRGDAAAPVHVVVNEEAEADRARVLDYVRDNLGAYGALQANVRVHVSQDILRAPVSMRGWRVQQIVKMLAHRVVETPRIVILDSKNHFIETIDELDFFASDDRPRTNWRKRSPDHSQHKWLRHSFADLGLDPSWADQPAPPTITPYPVTRDLLVRLTEHLDAENGLVETYFESKDNQSSEFFLIYAFVIRTYDDPQRYYAKGLVKLATIFNRFPETPELMQALLERVESGGVKVFSFHHGRKGRLLPADHARIVRLWQDKGLAGREDALEILGPPADAHSDRPGVPQ
ncbi:DUF6492 family protein [Wenxinia marina]|uniref:Uncharacterized protein n=1 Tax=Wenxinia marina DSM 24838 TaxID=1123501 RepID=A0A0D0PJ22_9RHOB|nr:DUF6492 family protein [Wenxinia marina]KIQ71411.1 hypothetical protein Wenmar_04121 [Wenxinia marina DSM 24838]GGL78778.1 hypothetical protein GCM10011392_36570 [Wenxinia marina]